MSQIGEGFRSFAQSPAGGLSVDVGEAYQVGTRIVRGRRQGMGISARSRRLWDGISGDDVMEGLGRVQFGPATTMKSAVREFGNAMCVEL
jgi:hypothetical protein